MGSHLGPRVVVTGLSGAGKTTFGRRLSSLLKVELIEVDELRHTIRPGDRLSDSEVASYLAAKVHSTDAWVVESRLRGLVPEVWQRASTIVWLHLPRWIHVWHIFRRHGLVLILGKHSSHGISRRRTLGDLRHVWAVHAAAGTEYEVELERRKMAANLIRLGSRAAIRGFLRGVERELDGDSRTAQGQLSRGK